jgi:hypothetical protein
MIHVDAVARESAPTLPRTSDAGVELDQGDIASGPAKGVKRRSERQRAQSEDT